MNIKNIVARSKKKIAAVALAAAVLTGTYTAREGDCPPFYVRKTGTTGGIALGVVTKIEEQARFFGPVISLYNHNRGSIYGATLNLCQNNESTIGGISASLISFGTKSKMYGIKVGGISWDGESEREGIFISGIGGIGGGTSSGIHISLADFYGEDTAPATQIRGVAFSGIQFFLSPVTFKGLEASVIANGMPYESKNHKAIHYEPPTVYGVQASIIGNGASRGHCLQLGLLNVVREGNAGCLLNYHDDKKKD